MSIKRVCVLSYTGINDSRAQRTIRSMSKSCLVDFFFIKENVSTNVDFNSNVFLKPITEPNPSYRIKLLRHSWCYLANNFFIHAVLNSGNKYDLIYSHDFPTSYSAYVLSKRFEAKLIYDIHDLYLETINQFFPINAKGPRKLIYSLIKFLMKTTGKKWETNFLKSVDLILTTNDNYKDYLLENYTINQILITPNYPEFVEVESTNLLYKKFSINSQKKIVLYHGALNEGRYLKLIVSAAQFLPDDIVIIVIGNGPLKPDLLNLVKDINDKKIFFGDFVSYKDLFPFVSSASLGIMLIEHINLSKKFALANKVTEYMACGIPVLASDSPENYKIVTEADCGYIISPSNSENLAKTIEEICNDPELMAKGERGKNAFKEKFNWDCNEPLFYAQFCNLIEIK